MKNKKIKAPLFITAGICLLLLAGSLAWLLISGAVSYFTYGIKGTITITVNGEAVKPQNIVAEHNLNREQVKSSYFGDKVRVKTHSRQYGKTIYEFDVEMPDGIQHFSFGVFKSHNYIPPEYFDYLLELRKEKGIWYADVTLSGEYGGTPTTFEIPDEKDCYVQMGP